jgi:hypothetical protein
MFSPFLERDHIKHEISTFLHNFDQHKHSLDIKRAIWIHGPSGSGKTTFIKQTLKDLNYDIIYYNSAQTRNKNMMEEITMNSMSSINVHSMFFTPKKLVIVMDEIESMNLMDKHGMTALLQLIRPKKTEKQKKDAYTIVPIICISNETEDKRIKEMRKHTIMIHLKKPTNVQINKIFKSIVNRPKLPDIAHFIKGDLHRLRRMIDYIATNPTDEVINNYMKIIRNTVHQESVKTTCHMVLNKSYGFNEHSFIINETDRTSLALLYHENIADMYQQHIQHDIKHLKDYEFQLNNICIADYMDRITFQKQIWIFNEMSSLIKTMYNHHHLHKLPKATIGDIRFTKILTKYSSEYNNYTFIQSLTTRLMCDEQDLYAFVWNNKDYILDTAGIITADEKWLFNDLNEFIEIKDIIPQELFRCFKYMNAKFNLGYTFS